jgi:hypothetical protein
MRAAIYARMSTAAALLVFTACVGSALAEPTAWKGADVKHKRFAADRFACGREASQGTPSEPDWDYFKACMEARGWKRNETSKGGKP